MRNTSSSQYLSIWVFLSYGYAGSTQIMTPYDADIDRLFGQLRASLDESVQDGIYRQIGEHLFAPHQQPALLDLGPGGGEPERRR